MHATTRLRRFLLLLAVLALPWTLVVPGCSTGYPTTAPSAVATDQALRYQLVVRQQPRPLRLHCLRVDLLDPHLEIAVALATDPDGPGPATAALESPLAIARSAGALALVNANRWEALPDAAGNRSIDWQESMPVEIQGLAASGGIIRNPPDDPEFTSVWLDYQGKFHLGRPADLHDVRDGIAGHEQLLREGRVLVPLGGAVQPRSALGLDARRRFLHLVVVDGRQPGYSEGMSLYELAMFLRELGCTDAVNLDGGGSSILVMHDDSGSDRMVNDPSTKVGGQSVPRPIPVGLVVRRRPALPAATTR